MLVLAIILSALSNLLLSVSMKKYQKAWLGRHITPSVSLIFRMLAVALLCVSGLIFVDAEGGMAGSAMFAGWFTLFMLITVLLLLGMRSNH